MSADGRSAIEVRIAVPADGPALIGAIEAIDRETEFLGMAGERLAWADRPAETLAALAQSGDGAYAVATEGDAIVGYVGAFAGHYRSTRGVLSIPHIGVRLARRRHGIARRLLATLEHWGRARAAHRVDLSVDEDNASARGLYDACGYQAEGRVREAALDRGRWRSYVPMAKFLDSGARALAPIVEARRRRPDSITVRFRPVDEADAAALRVWELALLSAPPRSLKAVDEVAAPERYCEDLHVMLAGTESYLAAAVTEVAGAEQVVGLVAASAKPGRRLCHDVTMIVNVLADYRSLGIGRRLHAIAEDWARARGAHRLSTAVHAANEAGLRFAAAMGFAQETVMRRYARFGDIEVDLVTFAKLLGEG